jgi:hypothetical protein
MKTITVEQFLAFRPCYPEGHIREIAGGKEEWCPLDILALESVPAQDRLWAVLREELIDAPILHEFACRCAERALARVENTDPRSVAAIETKRRWLRGEATDEELYAAGYAARDAAWRAAGYAARDAAGATARDAAWHAARYAAEAAAEAAAGAAAGAAAWDAEREWQVGELRELLRDSSSAGKGGDEQHGRQAL